MRTRSDSGSPGDQLSVVEDDFGGGLGSEICVSHEVDFLGEDGFDCGTDVIRRLASGGDKLAIVDEGLFDCLAGEGPRKCGLGRFRLFGGSDRFLFGGRLAGF